VQKGQLVGGRFRVVRKAAAGGMGQIFRAVDEANGETVAIKQIAALGAEKRFEREAEVLAAIVHPGVVRHVAHGEGYLVMEWVEGETLAHRLEERGLTAREALVAIGGAAAALGEVHRRGVVHRDVKPANLLFPEEGGLALKVIDFGIALRSDRHGALTQTGYLMGTPGYMSPEQIRGGELDARADVFALGCVLYECLTGRPAFSAAQFLGTRAKVLFDDPEPAQRFAPEIPAELDALVSRLLAKEPALRPHDATEIAALLAEIEPPVATIRRPVRAEPGATEQATVFRGGAAPVTCAVAACAAYGPAGAPPELARRAKGMGARFEAFSDGSVVAIFGPSPELKATLLGAADFALAARFASGVVALASQQGEGDLLARVSQLLAEEAMASAVGSPPPNAVRIDETSAQILGDALPRVDEGGESWLV
jgi:hypothetical protein